MARYPQTAGFASNVSARQDGGKLCITTNLRINLPQLPFPYGDGE